MLRGCCEVSEHVSKKCRFYGVSNDKSHCTGTAEVWAEEWLKQWIFKRFLKRQCRQRQSVPLCFVIGNQQDTSSGLLASIGPN